MATNWLRRFPNILKLPRVHCTLTSQTCSRRVLHHLFAGIKRGSARKYYKLSDTGRDYMQALTTEWNEFVRNVANLIEEGTDHE